MDMQYEYHQADTERKITITEKKLVFLSVKLQYGSKLGEKEVVAKVVVCNPVVSL